jgi:hypothetical protein
MVRADGPAGAAYPRTYLRDVSRGGVGCDDDQVTRVWRICVVPIAVVATALIALPSMGATATAPPTTESTSAGPTGTNDLIPDDNNVSNCIGTVEQANCGSRARADGHTYLVFLALAAGMTFIGWRIARGVRARDKSHESVP